MTEEIFPGRQFRICYVDSERRIVDMRKSALERALGRLGSIRLTEIKGVDDPAFFPCDLLIVAAEHVPDENFPDFVSGLSKRILAQQKIWCPAIIFSDVGFDVLRGIFVEIVRDNWYFDIVHSDQLSSLPVRVANLLRIHDHLHEMRRYQNDLDELHKKTETLEKLVSRLAKD